MTVDLTAKANNYPKGAGGKSFGLSEKSSATSKTVAVITAVIILAGITVAFASLSLLSPTPKEEGELKVFVLIMRESDDLSTYGFNGTKGGPDIVVNVGDRVKIILINEGTIPHAFAVVDQPGDRAPPIWESVAATAADPILPGEERTVTFVARKPGSYWYACLIPPHRTQFGMEGRFIVLEEGKEGG